MVIFPSPFSSAPSFEPAHSFVGCVDDGTARHAQADALLSGALAGERSAAAEQANEVRTRS